MTKSKSLSAISLPNGARFYKCALQVNPFGYQKRTGKTPTYSNEEDHNKALVQSLLDNGIEVVAITDHYRVAESVHLATCLAEAGIVPLIGFEAVTKDGVHVLCVFDSTRQADHIERIIGECGIHDHSVVSPIGKYDLREMLAKAPSWHCVCIAAHVAAGGGLLKALTGQARIQAWKCDDLIACSIAGTVAGHSIDHKRILENTDPEYRRSQPIALVNAQDLTEPSDAAKSDCSTLIKMSDVTVDGLRQSFLDPSSRIRLNSDPTPERHSEIVAMSWEGGFLDGIAIHFNDNLNVLIGGRGTGKSTVVESIRYVLGLEPLVQSADTIHQGVVNRVLRPGTKITMMVRIHQPGVKTYTIERTIPNTPIVRDEDGTIVKVAPIELISGTEVYGQHEISEVTKQPTKITRLLNRFITPDPEIAKQKVDLARNLRRSSGHIMECLADITSLKEKLEVLPRLEETLARYKAAGLDGVLKERRILEREGHALKELDEAIEPVAEVLDSLRMLGDLLEEELGDEELEAMPGGEIIAEGYVVVHDLENEVVGLTVGIDKALTRAQKDLSAVQKKWSQRQTEVEKDTQKVLRELKKKSIDGEEFIRLDREILTLKPVASKLKEAQKRMVALRKDRRELLAKWDDLQAREYRELQRAAKHVSRALQNQVRVNVCFGGNREPLAEALRGVGGRLAETIEMLTGADSLSLTDLAEAIRVGPEHLVKKFKIPKSQAERLAQANEAMILELEELELENTTQLELNVSREGDSPVWQGLDQLSTGQKATAVLLLLLLESQAPLIIDQPEDDLDNRFITENIVPRMKEEKRRRQFVFASHNANIPVLGDAELIVGFDALGDAEDGQASLNPTHMGSIDQPAVRDLVEEVLEGGREAFEMRRRKYRF